MYKMLYDSNFTYDSSMPVYENRPPSWPYTLDYKIFHDCMIPPCPTRSYPGVWQVPMVMWQDLNGGRCSMGDACSNPSDAEGVTKMIMKNFERHYTTNRWVSLLSIILQGLQGLVIIRLPIPQGTIRSVLPRCLVHAAAPQGGLHQVPRRHQRHAGRVDRDELAGLAVGT